MMELNMLVVMVVCDHDGRGVHVGSDDDDDNDDGDDNGSNGGL